MNTVQDVLEQCYGAEAAAYLTHELVHTLDSAEVLAQRAIRFGVPGMIDVHRPALESLPGVRKGLLLAHVEGKEGTMLVNMFDVTAKRQASHKAAMDRWKIVIQECTVLHYLGHDTQVAKGTPIGAYAIRQYDLTPQQVQRHIEHFERTRKEYQRAALDMSRHRQESAPLSLGNPGSLSDTHLTDLRPHLAFLRAQPSQNQVSLASLVTGANVDRADVDELFQFVKTTKPTTKTKRKLEPAAAAAAAPSKGPRASRKAAAVAFLTRTESTWHGTHKTQQALRAYVNAHLTTKGFKAVATSSFHDWIKERAFPYAADF